MDSDSKGKSRFAFHPKMRRKPRISAAEAPASAVLEGTKLQHFGQIAAVIAFVVPFLIDIPGLDSLGKRMLSIFGAAIMLWVTEAIPLSATAVLVIMCEVLLLSDQAILPVGEDVAKAEVFYAALASPVIILFLGGFMLADCAAKYGVDKALAAVMLRPFLGSPRLTLMGLMGITALLSMFMSNTATTATMFAVMIPVLNALPEGRARIGLALSIPVAANVGGIGTPVGTPPNAIALGALEANGMHLSFAGWMLMMVPFVLLILAVAWWWLAFRYVPRDTPFKIKMTAEFSRTLNAKIFYVVAAVTIGLWMTEKLHHVSSNTVGFLPVVLLMITQVMTGEDLKALDWPVLWLVGGGIAMGTGVSASGLDKWLIGSITWEAIPVGVLFLTLATIGFCLSNVIANSAAANLLIPLGVGLGTSLAISSGAGSVTSLTIEIVIILAVGCSLGMCLPISTPPNAIAYSVGSIPTKEMIVTGLVVGVTGLLILAFGVPWMWRVMGLI